MAELLQTPNREGYTLFDPYHTWSESDKRLEVVKIKYSKELTQEKLESKKRVDT